MKYVGLLNSIQNGDWSEFETDVNDQRRFINELGEPSDDYDRSYKQYLCQNYFVKNKKKIILLDVLSFLLAPITILFLYIKGLSKCRVEKKQAIITFKGMPEVVPVSLREKYDIYEVSYEEGASLGIDDLSFILNLYFRFWKHPYFAAKSIIKVSCYSFFIKKYAPTAIITFGEYSYTSSILTIYCHKRNIKHIDIMHGEKTYFIRDSYFHFDKCYVWDQHYVDLFLALKAEPTQFYVEVPPSIKIDCSKFYNDSYHADIKYYLATYNDEELKKIVSQMEMCKKKGYTVAYRPHPRYSNLSLLQKYVDEKEIEKPNQVPIRESISSLEYAVGSCSTVLTQAYFSGKKVILDDVAFEYQYKELSKRAYILSSYNLCKLSEFTK